MRRFASLLLLILSYSATAQVSVLTQHNNTERTGWNDKETQLRHDNVAPGKFGLVSTLAVDDQVYAQPLVATGLTIGSFTGTVLFVATVNNTIYAFDADDVSRPAPLWQTDLNPAGQRAPDIFDLQDSYFQKPCGGNYRDFSGKLGLVGTPVIDAATRTLYVATKTIDDAGNFYAYLNALDMTSGQHRAGSPRLVEAQVPGHGEGSQNGIVRYLAKFQNQRPALLVYDNTVYVASASHCDWGPYHGWILGYDAGTLNLKYTYNATPDGWAAGIWMAGQGISVGADGNLYLSTGNGTTSPDNNNLNGGRSESLLKMSPQLQLLDWFTPANYEYLDQLDLDYGCDGVLMIPNTTLTVSGSKEGLSYVVDYDNMGRLTPGNTQVKDTLVFNPTNTGYVHVHGSPVYAELGAHKYVYAWAESFKMRQFEFDSPSGTFLNGFKQGKRNLDNGMPGAMLSVSSDQQDTASAIVWASFPTSGNANNQVRPGTLAAYPANDVSRGELWNSDMNPHDVLGNFAKFNSPTVANGKVFVATFSNGVKVYGPACANALPNPPYADGIGLKAEYFSDSPGTDFPPDADVVKLDKTVNFNWGATAPVGGISTDNFKVRWTGKLRPLSTGDYTFYLTASDAVRLRVDGVLVIDQWNPGPISTYAHTLSMQQGTDYDIVLEYFSGSRSASCALQWSAAGICREIIPSTQLFPPQAACTGAGEGLNAEYFSNTPVGAPFPAVPTVSTIVPTIDFNWGGGAPAGISNDLFKARFKGSIQSTDAGTYTFHATADDGIRLWVNDQLLVDAWVDQGETEYTAQINLKACTQYPIRLEYYENGGDAVCKLAWSGPIFENQLVSPLQLTGAGERPTAGAFKLFPNPAGDYATLEAPDAFKPGDAVALYDILGVNVGQEIRPVAGSSTVRIPVSELPVGIYLVTITSNGRQFGVKLVKH